MWLRAFTDMAARASAKRNWAAGLVLLLAGCASAPPPAVTPMAGDDPAAVREIPPRAQTLYEQAVSALAAGDLVDARFRFEAFVLEYPDYPGAHVNLAIIHARNGDDQAAEGSLADALILDPEYAPALNQLGMLLRRQGKFDAAEDAYLKAVTADPGYALAHYNLGVLNELYLQRLDVALQHFELFQGLNGEDEQVGKWIVDLKRRLQDNQRTANRTE